MLTYAAKTVHAVKTMVLSVLITLILTACSNKPLMEYPLISTTNGYALGGYDLIAYYDIDENERPVKGRTTYQTNYGGSVWRFENASNASDFIGSPDDYLPMYNGYAADRLSLNDELKPGNPRYWAFFDHDLYFFGSRSGLRQWQQGDWKTFKSRADENFEMFIALKKGEG